MHGSKKNVYLGRYCLSLWKRKGPLKKNNKTMLETLWIGEWKWGSKGKGQGGWRGRLGTDILVLYSEG